MLGPFVPTSRPDEDDPVVQMYRAAIRKATKGRKENGPLTGPERRRVIRLLERKARRTRGEARIGFVLPTLSARASGKPVPPSDADVEAALAAL